MKSTRVLSAITTFKVTPEQAMNNAFAFALDMVASTHGQLPPSEAMKVVFAQSGYELTERKPSDAPQPILIHTHRADRDCLPCKYLANDHMKDYRV
jgi:hypothetical protein